MEFLDNRPEAARDGSSGSGPRDPEEVTLLRVGIRRKIRFRFQTLWLKEGSEKGLHRGVYLRRPGGVAEVELTLSGYVCWRASVNGLGERSVAAWPSSAAPPRIDVGILRWPEHSEGLLAALTAVSPGAVRGQGTAALEPLAAAVMEAARSALRDALGAAAARSWVEAGESNPLVELEPNRGQSDLEALGALAGPHTAIGFGGSLSEPLDKLLDLQVTLPPLPAAAARKWLDEPPPRALAVGCGHIRVDKDNTGGPAAFMAASAIWGVHRDPADQGHLSFEHQQRIPAEQARFVLPAFVRRYCLTSAVTAWLDAHPGEVDARVQVSVPAKACQAWLRLPAERRAAFYDLFLTPSRAIQEVLRQWTHYLHFQRDRFADYDTARAVIAFGLIKTLRDKDTRTLFTYDLLDPRHMGKAVSLINEPFADRLATVRRMLLDQGRPEAAKHYAVRLAPRMLREMRELTNRPFGKLLRGESQIINAFLNFAVKAPELLQTPRALFTAAAKLGATIDTRLDHMVTGEPMACIAPLVVAEATRALWAAQGFPAPLSVVVRLSPPGGSESVMAVELESELERR